MFRAYGWCRMTTPHEFGARLRAMRERRGITLAAIADTTKIGLPLLAALERDDLSRWPNGIFRRAFFRDYAAAIGAPVDDMLAEFLRLFPEQGAELPVTATSSELRMTFAMGPSRTRRFAARAAAGLADASVVLLTGVATAWVLAADRGTVMAVTAV